jgi:hypothetical protein
MGHKYGGPLPRVTGRSPQRRNISEGGRGNSSLGLIHMMAVIVDQKAAALSPSHSTRRWWRFWRTFLLLESHRTEDRNVLRLNCGLLN